MADNKNINNGADTSSSTDSKGISASGNMHENDNRSDIPEKNNEENNNENVSKKNIDWTTIALFLIVIINVAIYLHSVNRNEDSREDEQLAESPPARTEPVEAVDSEPSPESGKQAAEDSSKPSPGSGGQGASDSSKPSPGSGNKNVAPGSGNDNAVPGSGDDNIVPGSGNDSAKPGSGNKKVLPGSGNDDVIPGSGDDSVPQGSGNKNAAPGSGNKKVLPGSGNDDVMPGSGDDSVPQGSGNKNAAPGSGNKNALPGSGNDSVLPGSGNNYVPEGSGDYSVIPGSGGSNAIDNLLTQLAPGPDPAPLRSTYSNNGGTFPHPQDLTSALSTAKGQKVLKAMQKEKGAVKLTDKQKERIDKVIAYQKKYRELGAGVVAITAILNKNQLAYLRKNKDKLTDARLSKGNPIANALKTIKPKASSGVPRAVIRPSTAPEFNPITISVVIILLEQSDLALDANQAASITKYLEVMNQVNSSIEETLDDIITKKQRAYLEAELGMRDENSSVSPKDKGSNAHL